ncbi:hypothetical protein L836_5531 [Mycobacteroides abscessus MAB_110811_2726]|nr:hypothetical protein L836_5531 [Mycobacteroides abscessus MAB_110811_2726]
MYDDGHSHDGFGAALQGRHILVTMGERVDAVVTIPGSSVSLARVMGPPDCQGDGTTVARY